jgi:uncharacterized membrane protein
MRRLPIAIEIFETVAWTYHSCMSTIHFITSRHRPNLLNEEQYIMAKTATFGILHVATSFTVTYALTGSFTIAGVVTLVEPVVNTVMHYFFDKYWDHPRAEAARLAMARAVAR